MVEKTLLKFKKLSATAKLPTKGTGGAACYDIYSDETVDLEVGEAVLVKTGWAVEVPPGYCMVVYSRSSMFAKRNVLTTPLIVDSDYRGEVLIALRDGGRWSGSSFEPSTIVAGERIAQFKIEKVPELELVWVDQLSETKRGSGGYGSTGR